MSSIIFLLAILSSLTVLGQEKLRDIILYPYYKVDITGDHEIKSIIDGYAALQLRLEMIRRAKN
jgi:hypothetical protein